MADDDSTTGSDSGDETGAPDIGTETQTKSGSHGDEKAAAPELGTERVSEG